MASTGKDDVADDDDYGWIDVATMTDEEIK